MDVTTRKTCMEVSKDWLNLLNLRIFAKLCPLVIEDCAVKLRHSPKIIFQKTRAYRRFPVVKLGRIDADNQQKLFEFLKKIGRYTYHLTLTATFDKSILKCFPKLEHLELSNVDDLMKLDYTPPTLETLTLKRVSSTIETSILEKMKSIESLKKLYARQIQVVLVDGSAGMSQLATLSDDLKQMVMKKIISCWLRVSKNLLAKPVITCADVLKVYFECDNRNVISTLNKFCNLEVRVHWKNKALQSIFKYAFFPHRSW